MRPAQGLKYTETREVKPVERETDTHSSNKMPRIVVPKPRRPSQKEIERRRAIYDHLMRLREGMKPMDISAGDLIRQVREEAERGG